jgi:hypothetical protein
MFPTQRPKQLVKPTLARFVEDRLTELELSYDNLVDKMGIERIRLTRRINHPGTFSIKELRRFVEVLEVKDAWEELITPYGTGMDKLSARDLETIVREGGYELGRVNVAA